MSSGDLAGKTAAFYQKQFKALGLALKVTENDWPTLQRKVHEGKAQTFAMGWHADYADAENFLQIFYGGNIEAGTNHTGYSKPAYDKLFERARVLGDSPQRRALYAQMAAMVADDCPVLPLSQSISYSLHHQWLRNLKPHPYVYGTTKYLRLDPAAGR